MMRSVILFLLVSLLGCAPAEPPEKLETERFPGVTDSVASKVWVRADSSSVPGTMRVFLPNGTLIMDSCWETYRLVYWRAVSESVFVWSEDGRSIMARVIEVGDGNLTLQLELPNEPLIERYQLAMVPYVCPDIPK